MKFDYGSVEVNQKWPFLGLEWILGGLNPNLETRALKPKKNRMFSFKVYRDRYVIIHRRVAADFFG